MSNDEPDLEETISHETIIRALTGADAVDTLLVGAALAYRDRCQQEFEFAILEQSQAIERAGAARRSLNEAESALKKIVSIR